MAKLLKFPAINPVILGRELRQKRLTAELTLAQAATALGISPTTLDGWEQGRKPQMTADHAENLFEQFRRNTNHCRKTGNNLIFGVFPIRIARDILDVPLEEIAEAFGYSASSWAKMEANARIMPKEKIEELEVRVARAWNAACMTDPPPAAASSS